MRIGELARRTGASARALRYYEQQGLITSSRRSNGYRDYDELAVTRVGNIRMLLDVGMNTDDIGHFGACLDEDLKVAPVCEAALARIERRMRTVEHRMSELAEAHRRLGRHLAESKARA